jgi:ABC-type amino acid transport substrate-binding protein
MSNYGYMKSTKTTLAKPWILPFVIVAGLAAAWAAPWSFVDGTSASFIFKTLVPLIIQVVVGSTCAVLAFLGKPAWLPLLITTISVSLINALSFSFGIFGVKFGTAQAIVLTLVAIALIPSIIWGRNVVDYSVTTDMPTFNADPNHDNW